VDRCELELTEEQELLRRTTARFIEDSCPLTEVRALSDTGDGVEQPYLRRAADLGWFALLIPEDLGGGSVSGDGVRDACIVGEERGRSLQPGPFIPMNVVASALASSGTAEQKAKILPAILAGESVATWALADPTGRWEPGAAVTVTLTSAGFALNGVAGLVQDGHLAEWLLVTAGGVGTGATQFLVPADADGVTVHPLASIDITQRFANVEFDRVQVSKSALLGGPGTAGAGVERQLQIAFILSVAESVGAMEVLFEMSRQYSLDRIAFGRPIGSFQAVKHQLADLSMRLEATKAVLTAATQAVQAATPDAGEIASIAKAWSGEAGIDVSQGCLQVFGGIGYTWEHDCHLFLRRLAMNHSLFGSPEWHRERIVRIHGL
jgi:alkylation response protein AidB-like acyl-CoA dehydrogenase